MVKLSKRKRKAEDSSEKVEAPEEAPPPAKRSSEDTPATKPKWTNRQRVLVFATRGIGYRDRHLMEDLKKLMPHHKDEPKMERTKSFQIVNEICEVKNCNKSIMFEGRKKRSLYAWFSNVPNGPSAKFLVENVHTMSELKMTGNCLRGSRPLLSFDPSFNEKPHYALLKELFTQIFGVPYHHPKSQPFFDHVYTFTVLDNRVWFRNFQILSEDGALVEIGPRFVLNPIKIFSGSFGGAALWENPNYITPTAHSLMLKKQAKYKYVNRIQQKVNAEATKPETSYNLNPLNDIFSGTPLEKAKAIEGVADENDVDQAKDKPQGKGFKKSKRKKKKVLSK